MIDFILAGLLVAFGAYHAWIVRELGKERTSLVNAVIAKDGRELRDLQLTEKVKPIEVPKPVEPNLVPVSDLSEEEFEKMISTDIA